MEVASPVIILVVTLWTDEAFVIILAGSSVSWIDVGILWVNKVEG
jgi:hypothetical protein